MQEQDPDRGAFCWAALKSRRFLNTFTGGGILAAAFAVAFGAAVRAPSAAGTGEQLAYGLGGFLASLIIVVGLVYGTALMLAPYQQRNALRAEAKAQRTRSAEEVKALQARAETRLETLSARAADEVAALRARVAELETAPVAPQHLQQLHQIAGQLRDALQAGRPPLYGLPTGIDEDIWRTAFLEHFPALTPGLEIAERKGTAVKAFGDRLEREARETGMNDPPWAPDDFIPATVTMTEARAVAGGLAIPFSFGLRAGGGTMVIIPGDVTIARGLAPNVHTEVLFNQFCNWLWPTQSWPEATAIRDELDECRTAAEDMAPKLKTIENLVTVTTRCYLCRRGDGKVLGPILSPAEDQAARQLAS
jgi:hypothetical protein